MSFATDSPRTTDPFIHVAIREADRIRREHNDVGGVYLYLGHDGDNVCTFKDIDGKEIAKASSGRSLLDAVEWCERERVRTRTFQTIRRELTRILVDACNRHLSDRLFHTANFQNAVLSETTFRLTVDEAHDLLASLPEVVELEGGCHWVRLPVGYRRIMPSPTPEGSVA